MLVLHNSIVSTFKSYLYYILHLYIIHIIYYKLESFYFPFENFGLHKNPMNVTVTCAIKISYVILYYIIIC